MSSDEIRRGNAAERILSDPIFLEAFSIIEKEVIEEWRKSPMRDTEGRERLYMYQAILSKVKAHLQTTMETGMLSAMSAEQKTKRAAGLNWLTQ